MEIGDFSSDDNLRCLSGGSVDVVSLSEGGTIITDEDSKRLTR